MKIDMTKAHVNYFVFTIYRKRIETQPFKDQNIKPLLEEIGRVWALNSIMENVGPIFDTGYFSPSAFKFMNEALD